jgi:hypothetical protein
MCTYLTYQPAEYHARSVFREVPTDENQPRQPDAATLSSIVGEALLPFPQAAAAVLALVNKRLGTEVPI